MLSTTTTTTATPTATTPHNILPTPPSSPPTIGMQPAESTISLLESLVGFYHQERMWVYRTRAQLEMAPDVSPSLDRAPDSPPSAVVPPTTATVETASSSPSTKWVKRKKAFNLRLEGISSTARAVARKHPYLHTQHRARQSSNLNPASHQHTPTPAQSFYPPTAINTATTLTSPYLSYPPFQFSAQPLTPEVAHRYVAPPAHHAHAIPQSFQSHTGPLPLGAGGREPTVEILEMFERMMQARMESCERVTRMVREANNPAGTGVGGTGVVGGVGGPVGGFGGPAGLSVSAVSQDMVGGYQANAQVVEQHGFPMVV